MRVKRIARWGLDRLGVDVGRPTSGSLVLQRKGSTSTGLHRQTMRAALEKMVTLGFVPSAVVDVGAASGTHALYDVFPTARHLLIEPLEEFSEALTAIAADLDASVFIGVAGARPGHVTFNVHPDLNGSSLFKEHEEGDVNGIERVVPQSTLDLLCADAGLLGPYLLKIDTQGSELEVLIGALEVVLPQTEVAILEVSMHPFFETGPEAPAVVAFMSDQGFALYDIVDLQYRPLDGAMSQADFVFVRVDSLLRKDSHYANPEQRQKQNESFQRRRMKRTS